MRKEKREKNLFEILGITRDFNATLEFFHEKLVALTEGPELELDPALVRI